MTIGLVITSQFGGHQARMLAVVLYNDNFRENIGGQ
jgi:hypothetical protein